MYVPDKGNFPAPKLFDNMEDAEETIDVDGTHVCTR